MGKKNIKPQQQQPVVRQTTAKSITEGLTEENLTGYAQTGEGMAASNIFLNGIFGCAPSFDGDDAE